MIVDIFMPNMRGFESIRVFHNHAPKVPLIAISGYAFSNPQLSSPDFLRMALKLGACRRPNLTADMSRLWPPSRVQRQSHRVKLAHQQVEGGRLHMLR
jgi:CheY-like chemotaxis protein